MTKNRIDPSDPIAVAQATRAIMKAVRGRGPAPAYNAAAYYARQRWAQNLIKKLLRRRPETWRPPIIGADMLAARYRDNITLDSLFPGRKRGWIPPLKRRELSEFTVRQFSLLDHPLETLEALAKIAELDATQAGYLIHFEPLQCDDVAPFIVLGLMRAGMTPAASGGRLSNEVARMLEAVGLHRFLGMRLSGVNQRIGIWPLPLQTKEPGQSDAASQAFGAQRKEKVTDTFVSAIDEWLFQAGTDDLRYGLTRHGKATIAKIFSEILDNAERHTIEGDDRGGGWRVAGFMSKRHVAGVDRFVCNISIVSLGVTIGESLSRAEDSVVAGKLNDYCQRHRKNFGGDDHADDLLRTVCALQDRVSRVAQTGSNPHGGVGLMDMIDVVNKLGLAPADAVQPQVTIYSGTSCVMVRTPYSRGACDPAVSNSPRTLWLNAQNSLEYSPSRDHVFNGRFKFPGTIVTARFSIDEKYLANLGDNDGEN